MKSNRVLWILAASLSLMTSCDEGNVADDFDSVESAVINGTKVTGDDRMSTVSLMIKDGTKYYSFCTGTLISPNYILTAGHCVGDCDGESMADYRANMYVGFGQSEGAMKKKIRVYEKDMHLHPNFVCNGDIKNDLAIIKLSSPIDRKFAVPALIIPPSLMPTKSEIDKGSVMATSVGFGLTNPYSNSSGGTKYQTTRTLDGICSKSGPYTSLCSEVKYAMGGTDVYGLLLFYNTSTNVCSGDSGGPTFVTRNGVEYQIGVSSWVSTDEYGHCTDIGAMTNVNDFRSFIAGIVTDLPAEKPEICDNGIDDNNDGRLDCQDPYCFGVAVCEHENCNNGIDDDGNGQIDCKDAYCKTSPYCQVEDCSNGIDDNANGLIDCNDPQCAGAVACKPENCTNGIDDNANGLKDCDDPQCYDAVECKLEDCFNGIDDNANGLIDCDDPQCAEAIICVPENCTNGIDDNMNGLIDCADPQCAEAIACVPENCTNGIDDNMNGLLDCADPQCADEVACKIENCSNGIDDNANGLIDCADPQCASASNCIVLEEDCTNGKDDDKNGLVDCADPACISHASCQSSEPGQAKEICDNNVDDDKNGLIDCADPACASQSSCSTDKNREICDNYIDDDKNGLIDCEDPACMSTMICVRQKAEICDNKIDDNMDGKTDCEDPACQKLPVCVAQNKEICDNKVDDNGDGKIDCEDPTCECEDDANNSSSSSCSATPSQHSNSPLALLSLLFGFAGLARLRRRA